MYYLPCYDYVNNIWWTVTVMKLTTESSASLYSYLPPTPNILLTTLYYTHLQSVFFSWCKTPNFTPTQNERRNISFTDKYIQHYELNGRKYCVNLFCSFYPRSCSFSKFCQDLTYLKLDLWESDSGTSRAMWRKKTNCSRVSSRPAPNPWSTVQLFLEQRLPEKQDFPNIC